MRMRIALVSRRWPPQVGGAERVLSYLARALADAGADVTVLTSRVPGEPRAAREPGGEAPDADATSNSGSGSRLRVRRLPTWRLRFFGTLRYMLALRRALEDARPDVVYVSMLKHDAHVAVGYGRARGTPVALRPEGAGATGDVAWQSWGRFGSRIAARCRLADAVAAISPAIRAELLEAGYDADRIRDLPNGVPTPTPENAWRPRIWTGSPAAGVGDGEGDRDRDGGGPRALFLGRLAPEKGLDRLIRAWPRVRARFPSATLELVGEGPWLGRLERCRDEAFPGDPGGGGIRFPGRTDDPGWWHRRCDVFALPSREEGMSVALLEAMAAGMPIVASDIPGNRGVLTDGAHGRLIPADDVAGLGDAIAETFAALAAAEDAPERRATLERAAAARARVIAEFSIESVARRHLEWFEELIEARRRTAAPAR